MGTVLRNPDVLWREETPPASVVAAPEEAVAAILFADGQIVSLNELGFEIWKLCDGLSEEDIVARLVADFDVAEEVVRRDLAAFLADLAQKGFIRYG